MPPLSLDQITLDPSIQQRSTISEDAVASYAEIIDQLPPIQVVFDGCKYWLVNGFHRYHAAKRAAKTEIDCDIQSGTRRDAILLSCSANASNGLHRTSEDKTRAMRTLLSDPEWGIKSTAWLAGAAQVSQTFAARIRKEYGPPVEKVESRDGKTRPAKQEPKHATDGFERPARESSQPDRGEWVRESPDKPVKSGTPLGLAPIDARIRSALSTLAQAVDERNGFSPDRHCHQRCLDSLNEIKKSWLEWRGVSDD